jgi:hypothetical protein
MAVPQSPVDHVASDNEESKQNDGSSGSYESPGDPCLSVKRKRSSGPHDEDCILEEEVYEH